MRARLYDVLRRLLSQQRRNALKREIVRARRRLAPLYRLRYGTFSAVELRDELAARIPADTEIVMVHCSVNDLQPMYEGDVQQLLEVLLELCGPERTLAMPAFFFGGRMGDAVAWYRRQPMFDARRTPSDTGLLSEMFRRRQGVRRSLHPMASVCALGPLADELVSGHHLAPTTFGSGTPFGVMTQRQTAIVGIGIEYFRCLSQVHAAEDLLGKRFPLALRPARLPVELRAVDGSTVNYQLPVETANMRRRLERLELLLEPDDLLQWRFHGVPLFVTSATRVTEVLIDAALRGETIYDQRPVRRARRASPRSAA